MILSADVNTESISDERLCSRPTVFIWVKYYEVAQAEVDDLLRGP